MGKTAKKNTKKQDGKETSPDFLVKQNFQKPNKEGKTKLCDACSKIEVDLQVIESLIDSDIDTIQIPDRLGLTPLHYAAKNGKADLVKLLIEKGADVNALDADSHTPLHLFTLNFNYQSDLNVLENLIKIGKAALNVKDRDDRTALDIIRHRVIQKDSGLFIKCFKILATHTYETEKCEFVKLFRILYTAIHFKCPSVATFYLEKFYCDSTLNPSYHEAVKKFLDIFKEDRTHGNYGQLCIFLHDNYKKNKHELENSIDNINKESHFFKLSIETMIESDEALEVTKLCLKSLKEADINIYKTCVEEEFDFYTCLSLAEYKKEDIKRFFNFLEFMFNLDAGIDFNYIARNYVDACLHYIGRGKGLYYENLEYSTIFFAFCSDPKMSESISCSFGMMDLLQTRRYVTIAYERILNTIGHVLHPEDYYECAEDVRLKVPVFSLKKLCRIKVRDAISKGNPKQTGQIFISSIMSLEIPVQLKKYLRFID
uniref:CSON014482 protein n=1 Tax=Culicoides sonorensis TaxID=179676 RepID=A0A336KQE7_CULSO